MRCAPPESAIKLPSIAPRPNINAKWPSVPPSPASIEPTILSSGIPKAKATTKETIINETNVFNLNPIIKTSNVTIPIATITNGMTIPPK